MKQNPNWVAFFREQYPPGTRIRLREVNDPLAPVPPGTEGEVVMIDDACQIHMKWDNGRSLALIPGIDHFTIIQPKMEMLKLYMPLEVFRYERNRWGDMEEDPTTLDQQEVLCHRDHIYAALMRERGHHKNPERGLMEYYRRDNSMNSKVQSLDFSVEIVDRELMGVAECRSHSQLDDRELELLKDYIIGQAADGVGESFEQKPISTTQGCIYVSLWSHEDSWQLFTSEELEAQQSHRSSPTLHM